MRIGTIAQHANIMPTGYRSVINDVLPGRLNNYPLWLWYDFTDANAMGRTSNTSNLDDIDDKGPYNISAQAGNPIGGGTLKGPSWFYNNPQGSHNFATGGLGADYLTFTNPANLSTREFTILLVFDYNVENVSTGDFTLATQFNQCLFELNGNASDDHIRSMRFELTYNGGDNHFIYQINKNDNSNFYLGDGIDSSKLLKEVGGAPNHDFNYVTIVGDSDGRVKMYFRGLLIDSGLTGVSEEVPQGTSSRLWTRDTDTDLNNLAQTSMYEFMVFSHAFTRQELYDLDLYVKSKYKYHTYGRINGQKGI